MVIKVSRRSVSDPLGSLAPNPPIAPSLNISSPPFRRRPSTHFFLKPILAPPSIKASYLHPSSVFKNRGQVNLIPIFKFTIPRTEIFFSFQPFSSMKLLFFSVIRQRLIIYKFFIKSQIAPHSPQLLNKVLPSYGSAVLGSWTLLFRKQLSHSSILSFSSPISSPVSLTAPSPQANRGHSYR